MSNIIISEDHGAHIATINRPEALNALNHKILTELLDFLHVDAPRLGVKVLILRGAGEKSFIAGADIKEMSAMNHLQMLEFCTLGQRAADALSEAPFVTIAAVNGYALGGGLEMALACDYIYASRQAKLGLPEVTLGIIPGFGGTQRLSRAIGTRKAKEMIFTGTPISADRAFEIGLVNKVCEPEKLMEDTIASAKKILEHGSLAVLQAKRAINTGYPLGLKEALELERNMCAVCFSTEERIAGMDKFLTGRR